MTTATTGFGMPVHAGAPGGALDAAAGIGRALCETAFWDKDRQLCNWLGYTSEPNVGHLTSEPSLAAIPEHLYSGSAGVALFLAELYRQVPEPVFADTAAGAIRRSIHYVRRLPGHGAPLSFFVGFTGIAYAAAWMMDLDRRLELEDDIAWLIDQAAATLTAPHPLDALLGNAGAIPALIALAGRPGLQRCLDMAARCGEELWTAANREQQFCAWDSAKASGWDQSHPPLTGLSHGAAGMIIGLLRAYAATGDSRFLETARGAIAYEDMLFNKEQGNWIDVRAPYVLQDGAPIGTFRTAWCHGAPGIALSRLLAMQLDPAQATAHEASLRTAVGTTISAMQQQLTLPRADATLCHGLAGLGEIVLICAEALDDADYRAHASRTAASLIEKYGAGGDWPCDPALGGKTPSLIIGTAGIGYHFLRLHAAHAVPPILLIEPGFHAG